MHKAKEEANRGDRLFPLEKQMSQTLLLSPRTALEEDSPRNRHSILGETQMHGDFFDHPLLQGDYNGPSVSIQGALLPMQEDGEDRSDEERRQLRCALHGALVPATDGEDEESEAT
jgi:hypothetical protein